MIEQWTELTSDPMVTSSLLRGISLPTFCTHVLNEITAKVPSFAGLVFRSRQAGFLL